MDYVVRFYQIRDNLHRNKNGTVGVHGKYFILILRMLSIYY